MSSDNIKEGDRLEEGDSGDGLLEEQEPCSRRDFVRNTVAAMGGAILAAGVPKTAAARTSSLPAAQDDGVLEADELRARGADGLTLTSATSSGPRGIDFKTGGTRRNNIRMRITRSGSVGIGTLMPRAKLHVAGATTIVTGGGQCDELTIGENQFGAGVAIRACSWIDDGIQPITFQQDIIGAAMLEPLDRLKIEDNGNVTIHKSLGIGTQAPDPDRPPRHDEVLLRVAGKVQIDTGQQYEYARIGKVENSSAPGLAITSYSGSDDWYQPVCIQQDNGFGPGPVDRLKIDEDGWITFYDRGRPCMRIERGHVGIGVVNPTDSEHEIDERNPLLVVNGYAAFGNSDGNGAKLRVGWDGVNDILTEETMGLTLTARGSDDAANQVFYEGIKFRTGQEKAERMRITPDGKIGIGTTAPRTMLHVNGRIAANDVELVNADCAEEFSAAEDGPIEPGTVMVIDSGTELRQCEKAYDTKVVGVVSGAGEYKPALLLDRQADQPNRLPIALMGKVYCKVDADEAPVKVGDLLTTSATCGHAMKATDPRQAFGAIIGKALGALESGTGLIPILVTLQ